MEKEVALDLKSFDFGIYDAGVEKHTLEPEVAAAAAVVKTAGIVLGSAAEP